MRASEYPWTHTGSEKCSPSAHPYMLVHRQTWLYCGMLLCGEWCEGLEGLDGVDFAVNLQSLCTLAAASLIICRRPPITVENKGWGGQKIYHYASFSFQPSSIPSYASLSSREGRFLLPLLQGGCHNSHLFEFIPCLRGLSSPVPTVL